MLEESVNILEKDKKVWIVCYRNLFYKDVYNIWVSKKKLEENFFENELYNFLWKNYYQYKNYSGESWCFTLNPGLRRTKQMKQIMFGYEDYVNEYNIWVRYYNLWLITINIPVCNHIWWGFSSTAFFQDGFLKSLWRAMKNALRHYYKLLLDK